MALPASAFVSSAEAVFIAEVSDRDFNRAIDEHIIPESFVQLDGVRRVARLGAALISIYFKTEPLFTAQLRRKFLSVIAHRLEEARVPRQLFCLSFIKKDAAAMSGLFRYSSETVARMDVDLWDHVLQAAYRAQLVDRALELVSVDESILGGVPVFKGTRVPVETVMASLDAGIPLERLRESYDFLTPKLVDAARTYLQVRPRRGRPRRLGEVQPSWKVKSEKVVRPAKTNA